MTNKMNEKKETKRKLSCSVQDHDSPVATESLFHLDSVPVESVQAALYQEGQTVAGTIDGLPQNWQDVGAIKDGSKMVVQSA